VWAMASAVARAYNGGLAGVEEHPAGVQGAEPPSGVQGAESPVGGASGGEALP